MKLEGFDSVDAICADRIAVAEELKSAGRKIAGYLCCYVPVEIMTAAGLTPFRLTGNPRQPISLADSYVESNACPFIRSLFEMTLQGSYQFLDAYVVPDTCDSIINTYTVWLNIQKTAFTHFLTVPHIPDARGVAFFKGELLEFKNALEQWVGKTISDAELRTAISLHNENRALLRQLYELRKEPAPSLRGSEVHKAILATMTLPVQEANQLLRSVLQEVEARAISRQDGTPRILVSGNEMDHPMLLELIEAAGAEVVTDDLCFGTRYCWHDVTPTADPFDGLAERYLGKNMCPRTLRGLPKDGNCYADSLDEQFGHLRRFIADSRVDGVVVQTLRYCDLHQWDEPELRAYLEGAGTPVLSIESDYTLSHKERLKTLLQAFIERIEVTK